MDRGAALKSSWVRSCTPDWAGWLNILEKTAVCVSSPRETSDLSALAPICSIILRRCLRKWWVKVSSSNVKKKKRRAGSGTAGVETTELEYLVSRHKRAHQMCSPGENPSCAKFLPSSSPEPYHIGKRLAKTESGRTQGQGTGQPRNLLCQNGNCLSRSPRVFL